MMEAEIDIIMKRNFKDKIEWFSCNYDKEIAGWIMGTIDKDSIILEDLLIPEQEADSGGLEMTGKQLVKLRKEYGKKCEDIIGEWHSHHSMGAFFSGTDEDFMEQFSEPRKICIFIVSSKDTHQIRVEIRKPFKISISDLDYSVEENTKFSKQLQKEIDKKIKVPDVVTSKVVYEGGGGYSGYGGYGGYGNREQTTLIDNKEYNIKVNKMIKYYNGINKVTISDVPQFYAENFLTEFQHLKPKIFNSSVDSASIEITFENKEEAIKEMREVRKFFMDMIIELDDVNMEFA